MAPSPSDVQVALSTAPDGETAARIARILVEERLAACVNVVPAVRSIYRWRDRVEEEAEVLMVIKTHAERLEALAARLRALHPYELPELVALPVAAGSAPYLAWVLTEASP